MFRFLKDNFFLIIVFMLVLLLRLPSLFEPYWYGDEGITLTVGQALRRGALLYRDIDDNKTPLLYWLASIVDNLSQFKLLLLVWSMLTLFSFYQLVKQLLSGRMVFISTLVFIFLANTPILEANIINAEIFFLLMTISAMLLVWQKRFFSAGILFSLGFLFKVPALLDFLAALVFVVFFAKTRRWRQLVFGFILPLLMVAIYFWLNGSLAYFIQSVFLDNFIYTNSWHLSLLTTEQYLIIKTTALVLILIYLVYQKKQLSAPIILSWLWFFFALYGATLSSRPYTHYLIQVIPSLCLMIAVLGQKAKKLLFISLTSLLLIISLQFGDFNLGFWQTSLSYYQRFAGYISGQMSTSNYQQSFDAKVRQTYAVSQFLSQNTSESEAIFYWGDNALIYALSKRLPATRLTTAYNILARRRKVETLLKLRQYPPRFLLISQEHEQIWPQFLNFVLSEYQLQQVIEGVKIYEKKTIAV